MPLRNIIAEESVTPEAAKIMHAAYNAILAAVITEHIGGVSSQIIARKIASAVFEGETDSKRIAQSILSGLRLKKN